MTHVTSTFHLDVAAMRRTLGPHGAYGTVTVPRLGNQMVNAAKRRANVKTGVMRSRIEFRIVATTPVGGLLAARTKYSKAVHDGSRPHRIEPRNGTVLAFKVGGKTVYARGVNHPGYRGNPFLVLAAHDVLG